MPAVQEVRGREGLRSWGPSYRRTATGWLGCRDRRCARRGVREGEVMAAWPSAKVEVVVGGGYPAQMLVVDDTIVVAGHEVNRTTDPVDPIGYVAGEDDQLEGLGVRRPGVLDGVGGDLGR